MMYKLLVAMHRHALCSGCGQHHNVELRPLSVTEWGDNNTPYYAYECNGKTVYADVIVVSTMVRA